MSNIAASIAELMANDRELARLLPLVGGVTIIEYDGEYIQGSEALHDYLSDNDIANGIVDRIVICGKPSSRLLYNYHRLETLYPFAKVEKTDLEWQKTDFDALKTLDVLVFHMAVATGMTGGDYKSGHGKGALMKNIVCSTRNAYDACLLSCDAFFFDEDFCDYELVTHLRLTGIEQEEDSDPSPTDFCREKNAQMAMFETTLVPKDYFFQCMDEMANGCEECNLCKNYGKRKECPEAQKRIADCYRQGIFVERSEVIAHQWMKKAARQGYKSAHIQVADDLAEGFGCKQSKEAALAIYKTYARKGDGRCIDRVIKMFLEGEGKEPLAAIPYITLLAKEGDEEMVLKLSDAFQNGLLGLPKDMVQQEEWIRQGAENGNPRFVKAMAEMYEAHEDWAEAYRWYNTLSEIEPSKVPDGKLEEMELRMLTNGASDEEIAWKGMDYLYGWHGQPRDTHLAFRCFHYAKGEGIAMAEGLLGRMYYEGIGVEVDKQKGVDLMDAAAEKGDLMSMDKLIRICYSDIDVYAGDCWWEHEIDDTAEKESAKGNPFACYWKALNWQICRLSEKEALSYMEKTAELNYPPAQYSLAKMYEEGRGTEKDTAMYRQWLEKAAKNGYAEAESEYGVMLYEAWDRSTRNKAFLFLKNAIDKGTDNDKAVWCLGLCYMNGVGTAIDKRKAYPLYISAAEKGNADAQVKLCEDYFKGNDCLEKSYKECARWGEEAIKQGRKGIRFETAYSQSHIGNHDRAKELYLQLANEGNGVAMNNYACELSDYKEKAEWFRKAVDAGESYGMWNLGRLYRDGKGVEKDIEKALQLLRKSVDRGCIGAIEDLAWMYRYGQGVEKDGDEAVKWYKQAVEKGEHDCLLSLGDLYLEGQIVKKDVDMAIHFYKQAVEKGKDKAMVRLGEIYEYGLVVQRDRHKAIYWYRKAATKGNQKAKDALIRLGVNWIENGKLQDGKEVLMEDDLPF